MSKTIGSGKDVNWDSLLSEATALLVKLGYKESSRNRCRSVWKAFTNYAKANKAKVFSWELCEQFFACYENPDNTMFLPLKNYPKDVRSTVIMLVEFSLHGCWRYRRRRPQNDYIPKIFLADYQDFMNVWGKQRGLSQSTLKRARINLTRFLQFLEIRGIHAWEDLHPNIITGFMEAQAHYSPSHIKSITLILRTFLKHLYMNGVLCKNYSEQIPTVHIPMDQHLPSIWTRAEVDAILAAVDRGSPMGKRDYAMLLLACRLGLRAIDVRNLKLENLRWDESRIVLKQTKTGVPLSLPLTEEVGEAIIDYLRNGRPPTSHREIFLRMLSPIAPLASGCMFYAIVKNYSALAGLRLTDRKKKGYHSLRHSVACQLLKAEVPFETISDILGHTSLESTKTYARVDLQSLRAASLDPEEVFHA